jgi:DNA-directed RNA polymerase II subunit RPB1
MDKILNDTIIRGIKNIEKINLRQLKKYKYYNKETGNYEKKDAYVLDTIGTNLIDILALDNIDVSKTFSNDVIEMYNVLGIEAARKCLFNEILDVMEFDGTYINHHHIHLLCDRMTCNEKLVSIFRHGINKDDIGPIAKASFEETTEMFLKAARHGEMDNMRGVSANVMCGQEGYFGTSSFQTYVDNDKLFNMIKEYSTNEEEPQNEILEDIDYTKDPEDIIDEFEKKQDREYGLCSIENLKVRNGLSENITKSIQQQDDNDFELDI